MTNELNEIVAMAPEESLFSSAASLRLKSNWFISLRWWAMLALASATLFSKAVGGIPLEIGFILAICGLLGAVNVMHMVRNLRVVPDDIPAEVRMLKLQMIIDLFLLTVILNLTGGVENPFHYIYVVHVVIASLLFKGREVYTIALLSIIMFSIEILLENLHILPHHHMPHCNDTAHSVGYLSVAMLAFGSIILFSAYMASTVMKHNRILKDELVDRQQQLVDSGKAKMSFFRFITHEIKSPVVTAMSAIDAALDAGGHEMAPPVKDILERAVKRLGHATDIVKDLADFTQGGVLREPVDKELDLRLVVTRVVDDYRELIKKRELAFELDLPELPLPIRIDEGMIEKVVTNLVSNAVRYNRDQGMLHIRLRDMHDIVMLTIEDGGIGIPPENQDKVFDEFFRTKEAKQVSSLGTGLGLPIVRKFVKQLGGDIALESELDVGTKFTITLRKT
jgi:signal transduction histidine kinase